MNTGEICLDREHSRSGPARDWNSHKSMKTAFVDYEIVKLRFPSSGFPAGTTGTVVMVYDSVPPMYEVEFADAKGITLALLTLGDGDLEKLQTL